MKAAPKMLSRSALYLCVALLVMTSFGIWMVRHIRNAQLERALLQASQAQILDDPALRLFVAQRAPGLYAQHCAACHGPHFDGDRGKGAPNLKDEVWLYGSGSIADIESTILYGIRSGHPRAHNISEMPAFGRSGRFTKQDVADTVEYLLAMSKQPHDEQGASRGQALYFGAGNCYDCHASDGYGVSDYGTPPLNGRGGNWLYGGDRAALYQSIYDGRRALCPAWIGQLDFVQIRTLAVYLHEISHHE
ncbi:c-type cytochrome [Hydrocarboniphaga sp.]|uniref:c-type cytochrome n=1 Tax=Hydrocarboniphaga sp. TaxID=2033016 RepID=UPI003D09B7AE